MANLKRFFWVAGGSAALAVVATLCVPGNAIAQAVRAALVQNVDEPGRNPFSEEASCFNTGCTAVFPAVPAGKRLVVTFINGGVAGAAVGSAFLMGGHAGQSRILPSTNSPDFQIVFSPMVAYYDAGETPTISCPGTMFVLDTTLTGYYINLP